MITLSDFYSVMAALVPLYIAMFLAYASIKWWKIFSAEQCSGINRFVALFAVPLLSFHFISMNNPYAMNLKFILADTLQKLIVLLFLTVWANTSRHGNIEWTIALFSVATLPNTLVMGIPLLKAMYGDFSGSLMVQVVVLQSIIWYTILLFLFEYRAGKLLISQQFPDTAGSIASIKVESDVVSLDGGRDVVETEAEVKDDGKLHVTVRRSQRFCSNFTDAEIYSLHSSRNQTPSSSFNNADFYTLSARNFNLGTSDVFGVPLGKSSRMSVVSPVVENENEDDKDLHMFVWNSGTSHVAVTPCKASVDSLRLVEREGKGEKPEESMIKVENTNAKPPTGVMTKLILIMVWRKLTRNPNTYSSLLGLTWSLISYRYHIKMPMIITKSVAIMSDTGLGMAMFSLGLFMAMQPRLIVCGKRIAASTMAVRFLVGPAIMAVASLAVGIRGTLLHVAIVQAALPLGIVPFVFAKEYEVHPDILSTGVIFGMLIALPVTLIYYIALGN